MDHPAPQAILLRDYTPPPYLDDTVYLRFDLDPDATLVSSTLAVRRNPAHAGTAPMPLDGRDLELVSVTVDGRQLATGGYARDDESITLSGLGEAATIEIVTRIRPAKSRRP